MGGRGEDEGLGAEKGFTCRFGIILFDLGDGGFFGSGLGDGEGAYCLRASSRLARTLRRRTAASRVC